VDIVLPSGAPNAQETSNGEASPSRRNGEAMSSYYDCVCDGPQPDLYQVAQHKARKEHACSECGRRIAAGESYERVRGIWEGDPGVYRTCCRCLALREWVKAHVPCFCWYHGNMIDDAIEEARNSAPEAPGFLFGAYRRYVAIKAAPKLARSAGTEK
jgi:hypothetical protein